MTRIEWPTATAALRLPMRRAAASTGRRGRCRGCGEAATAHWWRISPSQRLPWVVPAGSLFAAGDVVARAHPGPRGEVSGGREPGHVDADLGDDALGGPFADPGDRVEPVTGLAERGDHPVDLDVERGDRRFEVVDVVEDDPQHRGVMVPEPAAQRLAQLRDLLAQHALGQLGEHARDHVHRRSGRAASPGPTRPARPRPPSRA